MKKSKRFIEGLWPAWMPFGEVADACAAKAECSNAIHGKEIARNLRNITHDRPKTFWEAVQLMYLYALMSGTYNYGRMDEYLGDFLERDLQDHVLTREQAKDILTPLWKLMIHRQTTWDARVFVGGKGRRNERAANEVALLAIEVTGVVKMCSRNSLCAFTAVRIRACWILRIR